MRLPTNTSQLTKIKSESDLTSRYILFLVILSLGLYTILFSIMGILLHRTYSFGAYDFGIHIQAIYKLSRMEGIFNTVRGLNIWGDHVWLIIIPIAFIYRLLPYPEFIIVLQAFIVSLGALSIYLISKKIVTNKLYHTLLPLIYLMQPALHNACLESFHPEVLAMTFTLMAYLFLLGKQKKYYWLFVALALSCKEDISLGYIVFGLYVAKNYDRKTGLITSGISLLHFLFCIKVAMPFFNGVGFFRFGEGYWFSDFYNNMLNIGYYINHIFSVISIRYIFILLLPFGFLPILAPGLLLIALPAILINILSGVDYLTSAKYHYEYNIIPFIAIACVLAIRRIENFRMNLSYLVNCFLIICALISSYHFSDMKPKRLISQAKVLKYDTVIKRNNIVKMIPENVSVSTSNRMVNHLAHRNEIYMFPNPFTRVYYGINDKSPNNPVFPEYIVIALDELSTELSPILKRIEKEGRYEPIFSDNMIYVMKLRALAPKKGEDFSGTHVAPRHGNLIVNGDFEELWMGSLKGWKAHVFRTDSAYFDLDEEVRHSGSSSLFLRHNALNHTMISQRISIDTKGRYLFKGFIKTKGVKPEKVSGARFLLSGNIKTKYITWFILTGDREWTEMVAEIQAGSSNNEKVELEIICSLGDYGDCATGLAWFDELELLKISD